MSGCLYLAAALVLMTMAVLDALLAGRRAAQLAAQVALQGGLDGAGRAGGSLDAKLLEELDGAAAHAAAQHDISTLLVDEARHLSGLVTAVEGVGNHLHGFDFFTLHVDQGKVRTAPEVLGHDAFQAMVGFCRNSDSHVLLLID